MFVATAGHRPASTYVSAAALLLGCFTVGVFAVRTTTEGLMLIGALALFVVYLTGAHRLAWIGIFLAFASLPASLHVGRVFGPVSIGAYHVALLLAILFLIPAARLRFSRYALPLLMLLTVVFYTGMGLMAGNDPEVTLREAMILLELVGGFVVAMQLVRAGLVTGTIRTMSAVLWFSAAMILVSSFTGLQLAGRAESLQGETGVAAIRIITWTQAPALAVLTALVVASLLGRAKLSAWLTLGLPALTISLLSFSRHTLIALAVAVVVALVAKASWKTIRRAAVVAAASVAALAVAVPLALFVLQQSPAGFWLGEQLNAFSDRVFDRLSTSALAVDSSTIARLHEITNLSGAFGEAPLFGHGLGYAYQLPFGAADSFTATLGTTYAHNFYMWWLVKAGIVGMIAFALFALVPVIKAVRRASDASTIAAAVSMGLLATSAVNPLPLEPASSLVLGMALGAALAFSWRDRGAKSEEPVADESEDAVADAVPSAQPSAVSVDA